jgi:D-alanine-D-alanine ligase
MGMTTSLHKRKIAILFGGRSGEHEVSLMSARSVLSVIDRSKYDVIEIGITQSGEWLTGENVLAAFEQGKTETLFPASLLPDPTRSGLIVKGNPGLNGNENNETILAVDVFFPVLHGTYGEDGTIQGLFEMADVAYVGASVIGSSVGMEKGVFKDVMIANKIPVVKSIVVLRSEIEKDIESIIKRAEKMSAYPLFIKPANLGSSVGITKCQSRADIAEGLMEAAQYDRRVLIEQGVFQPREIEISVLGNDHPEASEPGEIVPGADFYSYDAKYVLGTSELLIPAPLSEEQTLLIKTLAVDAFKAIDCCGMARVDFLLETQTGKIFLNEVNTIPGFTKISMYPKLWEASGLTYASLVDRLIDLAFERKADRNRSAHQLRRDQ